MLTQMRVINYEQVGRKGGNAQGLVLVSEVCVGVTRQAGGGVPKEQHVQRSCGSQEQGVSSECAELRCGWSMDTKQL